MCGRFLFIPNEDEDILYDTYSVQNRIPLEVNYNISPSHISPVITRNSPNKIEMMNWGIKFPWMKGSQMLINARTETLTNKPSFRKMLHNRCVILSSGYYEWKSEEGRKYPYLIRLEGERYTPMSGLYMTSDENAEPHFIILTMKALKDIEEIHNRMPLLLDKYSVEKWLDKKLDIRTFLEDHENVSHKLEFFEISDRVNSTGNNDSMLIKPIQKSKSTQVH